MKGNKTTTYENKNKKYYWTNREEINRKAREQYARDKKRNKRGNRESQINP